MFLPNETRRFAIVNSRFAIVAARLRSSASITASIGETTNRCTRGAWPGGSFSVPAKPRRTTASSASLSSPTGATRFSRMSSATRRRRRRGFRRRRRRPRRAPRALEETRLRTRTDRDPMDPPMRTALRCRREAPRRVRTLWVARPPRGPRRVAFRVLQTVRPFVPRRAPRWTPPPGPRRATPPPPRWAT